MEREKSLENLQKAALQKPLISLCAKLAVYCFFRSTTKFSLNALAHDRAKELGIFDCICLGVRKKMFDVLTMRIPLEEMQTILDVGVTADRSYKNSNFFEQYIFAAAPHATLTALSDQDASWMEQEYKRLHFVQGDALSLPFPDSSFDFVFSSAMLEHVGCYENQKHAIQECLRVSKRYVFITTPNRWHPLEVHTMLPLLHWLPKSMHRRALQTLGGTFQHFSDESILNLLSSKKLRKILEKTQNAFKIDFVNFLGFPSNILLSIDKKRNTAW